jgi:acyl-CoA thioesterase
VADASVAVTGFDRDTTVRELSRDSDDGRGGGGAIFAADISPDWRAGRGPHGGYLAAIILRALVAAVAEPARAPRSLTIHYARAPKPGRATIATTTERAGRSLSTLSARVEQDGSLVALALAAFSLPWSAATELAELPMPDVAPPEPRGEPGVPLFEGAPPFTRQLVLQPRIGAIPFTGSSEPMEIGAWLGLAEPRAIDALSLAFFSDSLFSPPFIRMSTRATSPTIDLTVHFRAASWMAPRDADELCFARFRTGVVHEGFFEEDGAIWSADGALLAQSRQLAILMPLPIG